MLRRPVDADLYDSIPDDHRPSARAIVVLVFWSYFETRIERLFRETAEAVPEQVMDHLLDRHSFVGTRMDRLYKVVFSTTYRADLNELGYGRVVALPAWLGEDLARSVRRRSFDVGRLARGRRRGGILARVWTSGPPDSGM